MRAQHPRRSAHPRIFRINSPDARARHNIKRTQRNAPYHAELRTGVSAMPTFMHNGPGVRKRSHQTCTAAHDKHTAQDSTMAPALQRTTSRGPQKRRQARPEHQPATPLPCIFGSFSNGGWANSACIHAMAQGTLSVSVMAIWARFKGEVRKSRHRWSSP